MALARISYQLSTAELHCRALTALRLIRMLNTLPVRWRAQTFARFVATQSGEKCGLGPQYKAGEKYAVGYHTWHILPQYVNAFDRNG